MSRTLRRRCVVTLERSAQSYRGAMLALNYDAARSVAMVGIAVFVVGAVIAGILMKTIAQKLAMVAILGLLATLAWTQRTALEDCARLTSEARTGSATCTFFGQDVAVSTGRAG
jgi:hypothetical protein